MSMIRSFSVGEGDMFYINHGNDNFTIIDCCMSEENRDFLVEQLKSASKDKSIVRFISTHPDDDHILGISFLHEKMNIRNFYCVKNEATKPDWTVDFDQYCALRDDSAKAFYLSRGCSRKWINQGDEERGDSGIHILWPIVTNEYYKEALRQAKQGKSYQGMIKIAFELVEGRLSAVIHLTDWQDKTAKADSAVLSREANVHNVPIATDIYSAQTFIDSWKSSLASQSPSPVIFRKRSEPLSSPLKGIKNTHRVLAMVAHDNMKLEICRFAVEHANYIFENYDYILATGTTGTWLKRFTEALGRAREVDRIRCCNSGPLGGDIQIAYAVVMGLCQNIIFLQDPSVSHPHDSDIRLFEQAVVAEGVHVNLATNVASAKFHIYAGHS